MSQSPREFVARSRLAVPAGMAFAWHARPGAFERLVPPWAPVDVLARSGGIADGGQVSLRIKVGVVPIRWDLEHFGYREGSEFRDRQIRGPFGQWEHLHRFEPDGPEACWLEDHISYALPGGALGEAMAPALVRDRLAATFAYRHRQIARDLARQRLAGSAPRLTVALTGSSGLIGRALRAFLTTGGHRVLRLVRRLEEGGPGPDEILWDPDRGDLPTTRLEGIDAVVNLAGENVGASRWSAERKRLILESRRQGTILLAGALARLTRPPRVLLSASGITFYGPHGDEPVDERSPAGNGFLADVAKAWEAAAAPAVERGIRVAHPRFAAVLDPSAGALARFLTPFRAGVGGPLGSGKQMMSWVTLDDVVGALHHALFDDRIAGAFNVSAPEAVSNALFVRTLGQVLGRPALLPVPAFALRALFGEMADEMILSGVRVVSARLASAGFRFQHPQLRPALAEILGKSALPAVRTEGRRDELIVPQAEAAAA